MAAGLWQMGHPKLWPKLSMKFARVSMERTSKVMDVGHLS